jgi:hypothetical protein
VTCRYDILRTHLRRNRSLSQPHTLFSPAGRDRHHRQARLFSHLVRLTRQPPLLPFSEKLMLWTCKRTLSVLNQSRFRLVLAPRLPQGNRHIDWPSTPAYPQQVPSQVRSFAHTHTRSTLLQAITGDAAEMDEYKLLVKPLFKARQMQRTNNMQPGLSPSQEDG